MKKRTACFGWTKQFQHEQQRITELMRSGNTQEAHARSAALREDHRKRCERLVERIPNFA